MTTNQFVDISVFQPANIDWQAYKTWAIQWNGHSLVSMRSSYGVGYTDGHYTIYRDGARGAGIDFLIHYHYAYPQYNSPVDEANWQASVVGSLPIGDILMLDYEELATNMTNSEWAYGWLTQQQKNYPNNRVVIYASLNMVQNQLQDSRLANFGLILADWTYDPNVIPAAPSPWTELYAWQFTDSLANVPGFSSALVDANVYLGGFTMGVPTGWSDDGTTLTAPNGHHVTLGFREYVLTSNWNPANQPIEEAQAASPVERYNTLRTRGGTRQLFIFNGLGWNSVDGVFQFAVGNEIVQAYMRLDKVKSDLQALLSQL